MSWKELLARLTGSGPDTLMVPQANPGASYYALKAQIDKAVNRALGSGQYILGDECRGFEGEFAAWLGTNFAIGCASGTDALALALRGLGIGPGSAVATVSHTAVATVAAIEMVGATPLLLDIEPEHLTMDPNELAAVLETPPEGLPPIRAVIPVHLYGQSVDLTSIMACCARQDVAVVEDCAQAHGATYKGRRLGTFAQAGAFSFYPTKNLGAFGDGGAIATGNADLAERLKALRQYGWRQRFNSEEAGVASRLDELQAAILRVKLSYLKTCNSRRQAIAKAYDQAVTSSTSSAMRPPVRRANSEHVFYQYVLRVHDRDRIRARLRDAGVGTAVHYCLPVHEQTAYRDRIALGPNRCRVTSVAVREVVSLPMYPELTDAQVEQVCAALRSLG